MEECNLKFAIENLEKKYENEQLKFEKKTTNDKELIYELKKALDEHSKNFNVDKDKLINEIKKYESCNFFFFYIFIF